jgi:aryl-alcohol dehydrogenase-like predicted oxidoreductase
MQPMWSPSLGARSVGIGEVGLAIAAARGNDRAGVSRALHVALETGLELVDLAAEDDAERLAGEVIRDLRLRDKAIAAVRIQALSAPRARDAPSDRMPLRYVQARVEAALRNTRLDALPLS